MYDIRKIIVFFSLDSKEITICYKNRQKAVEGITKQTPLSL